MDSGPEEVADDVEQLNSEVYTRLSHMLHSRVWEVQYLSTPG
jgi:hypothetical protein